MGKKKADVQTQLGLFKGTEVWASLLHSVPLVCKFVAFPEKGCISLKVTYRGADDFLAIAKRYGDDGIVQVCFGSGIEYVAALIGLEQAMDMDKWRPDKWANG